MTNSNSGNSSSRPKPKGLGAGVSVEHYFRLLLHRKWMVLGIFVVVSIAVALYARTLPNIYSSEVTILIDPQRVPESYVKSTVTGDIRNRIGTLSNQILSATRLEKIIDTLNLYPEERKKLAREDVILKMHADISTTILSDFGGSQDLQAFKITYFGKDPRLVAQVTNQLAYAFIDENLKTREQAANGTTEFLVNQIQETRKTLEAQEAKIKDFKLKHIGEMPEQQTTTLQIQGQLQARLQSETDALTRAQEQKSNLETMLTQTAQVIDTDPPVDPRPAATAPQSAGARPQQVVDPLVADRASLAGLLARYGPNQPDVVKLKRKIEMEEAEAKARSNDTSAITVPVPPPPPVKESATPNPTPATRVAAHYNPIIESGIRAAEAEIARHKTEKESLEKQVASYRGRLDAIPVREQEIVSLTRDYEMSKAHYNQLMERELSAETASQLEIRQKGEKFEVLDPAVAAERPARPNRVMYYAGGALAGLALGLLAALATEFMGMAITDSQDVLEASGVNVLGVIPVILTQSDKLTRRRRWIMAAASATFATLVVGVILFLKMHDQA